MEKIFRLLKKEGETQAALAKFLGVRKSAVSNWKRGGNISPINAKGIIRFFKGGVTLQDIYPMRGTRRKCA